MSELATCHGWIDDEWWVKAFGTCGIASRIIGPQFAYCPTCGVRLNADGTVTAMVAEYADPHDGLRPSDVAQSAQAAVRMALASQSSELAIIYAEQADRLIDRLSAMVALQQAQVPQVSNHCPRCEEYARDTDRMNALCSSKLSMTDGNEWFVVDGDPPNTFETHELRELADAIMAREQEINA